MLQTIQDLIAKTSPDAKDSLDNSSSNPDSPRDKISFSRSKKGDKGKISEKINSESVSNTKPEKGQLDLKTKSVFGSVTSDGTSEVSKPTTDFVEGIKKLKKAELPAKPTFLQSREASIGDGNRASPVMKLRTSGGLGSRSDSGSCTDRITTESSSGSEQDGFHYGRKPVGKRSLRKTKSRGKGKGPDDLEPSLILDEEGEGVEETLEGKCEGQGETVDIVAADAKEQVIKAEVYTKNQ